MAWLIGARGAAAGRLEEPEMSFVDFCAGLNYRRCFDLSLVSRVSSTLCEIALNRRTPSTICYVMESLGFKPSSKAQASDALSLSQGRVLHRGGRKENSTSSLQIDILPAEERP
jgi:hypothetical protein